MLVRRCLGPALLGLTVSLAACSGSMSTGGDDGDGGDGGDGEGGSNAGGKGGSSGSGVTGSDPGSVALHRLSKVEYNNTVRDLLGTSLRPADDFGFTDILPNGFGNNAKSLALGTMELPFFQAAAEKLANEAMSNATIKGKLFTCDLASGDACVKSSLKTLATRAFRRPVQDAEVNALAEVVKVAKDNGDTVDVGMGLAIQAILLSPNFLFRVELDPEPTSDKAHPVTSWEMASRLSYFLWATMPDAELLTAAEGDKLKTVDQIRAQATRMLKDGKAGGLVDGFGDYWTTNLKFEDHIVDTNTFKTFDAAMRESMLGETRSMLKDVFSSTIGFDKFMYGDYTYANDALATHYGLPKPGSSTLKKVMLPEGSKRGSFMTQGSFLAATSQDKVTSVVQRGKFVVFNLMCQDVASPNMDVPALDKSAGNTVREKFEAHRKDPKCAGCHRVLDPPGLALEQYDAIGGFRTKDGAYDINAKVQITTENDGEQTFDDAVAIAKYISTSDGYAHCVSKSLFSYGLGRSPNKEDGGGDMDDGVIAKLEGKLKSSGWKFEEVVKEFVATDAFRMRRAYKGAM